MLGNVLVILFFLFIPAGVLWLCRRVSVLDKIGPVLILYIIGILFGNLFHPSGMAKIQEILSSAMVPLAIPLMLFSCTFRRSGTKSQLLALLSGLFAVTASVTVGFFIFGGLFGVFRLVSRFGRLHEDLFGDARNLNGGSIRQRADVLAYAAADAMVRAHGRQAPSVLFDHRDRIRRAFRGADAAPHTRIRIH